MASMSLWWPTMVDGAKFWISDQRLIFPSNVRHWQLIWDSAPSTTVWHQCDFQMQWWDEMILMESNWVGSQIKFVKLSSITRSIWNRGNISWKRSFNKNMNTATELIQFIMDYFSSLFFHKSTKLNINSVA